MKVTKTSEQVVECSDVWDTHMFCKDHECIELLGQCKDESRVVKKGLNWTFAASVEEHRT